MHIIDVHCHLQASAFNTDIGKVIEDAHNAGVVAFINSATEPSDWQSCRELQSRFKDCHYALGIHPWYISEGDELFLDSLNDTDYSGAIAIGEIGLDKKFSKIDLEIQQKIFCLQLDRARSLNLPVVIHCIGAWSELIECLDRIPVPRGGVVHNFNGSAELAQSLMRKGLSFSLGGTLTYRDSSKRAAMLQSIYPDHLMLETDSPDIPPIEKPKVRNEPSFIRYTLAAASEILGTDQEIIANITTRNAGRMFGLQTK
jgi:TatD DNase family protein